MAFKKNCSTKPFVNLYPKFLLAKILTNTSVFILFVFISTNLNAQSEKIKQYKDSIKNTTEESLKVNYQIKLSREIHRKDHDKDEEYKFAKQAVELALQLNDTLLYAKALDNFGLLHRFHEDYAQALNLHTKAFHLIEKKQVEPIHQMIFANNAGVAARYNQNYDTAVKYYLKALKIAEEENNLKNIAISSNGLGNTLTHVSGREQETINYFERSLQAEKDRENDLGIAMNYLSIGDFYTKQNEYEKAKKYLYKLLELNQEREDLFGIAITEEFLGIAYLSENKNLNQAIVYFESSLEKFEEIQHTHKQAELLSILGEAYFKKNEFKLAENFFQQSIELAKKLQQFGLIQSNAQHLSEIAEQKGDFQSALSFYKTSKSYEDSLQMNEQKVKIEALTRAFDLEKKETEIELLEKDKALQEALVESKEEQLAKREITTILLAIGFGLTLLIFLLQYRNYKIRKEANQRLINEEKDKLKAIYERNIAQAEILVSRLRVNPHFLFNSLNAITYLVQSEQNKKAIQYLKTFSRYTRMVLETSKQQVISLKEELELAKYYLLLEENRFEKDFNFEIQDCHLTKIDDINIPPILLQPFLENAIWHGLLASKKEIKKLIMSVSINEDFALICIDDNGIGRAKRKAQNIHSSKHKSMGMQITKERIKLYNKTHEGSIDFEIIDKKDDTGKALGTKVCLKIKYLDLESHKKSPKNLQS